MAKDAVAGLRKWISSQKSETSGKKASKSQIVVINGKDTPLYMGPEEGPFRCDHCEYFHTPSSCELVAGSIDPAACCSLFEKKD
jgi:hypothetical protein